MGFVLLLWSTSEGWSLPPCPGSPTASYKIRTSWNGCFGTYKFPGPSRTKYVGQWRDGWEHGQGSLSYADGRVKQGIWEEGKFLYAAESSPQETGNKTGNLIKRLTTKEGYRLTNIQ